MIIPYEHLAIVLRLIYSRKHVEAIVTYRNKYFARFINFE